MKLSSSSGTYHHLHSYQLLPYILPHQHGNNTLPHSVQYNYCYSYYCSYSYPHLQYLAINKYSSQIYQQPSDCSSMIGMEHLPIHTHCYPLHQEIHSLYQLILHSQGIINVTVNSQSLSSPSSFHHIPYQILHSPNNQILYPR